MMKLLVLISMLAGVAVTGEFLLVLVPRGESNIVRVKCWIL